MTYAIYPALLDKNVVVTGGGSGIGASIVEAYAQQGARVTFLDVARPESEALASSLAGSRNAPVFRFCDLTDINALNATFAQIEEQAGPVEVLVNNAANDDRHRPGDISAAYWDQRIQVNLRHQYFCAQAVMGGMKRLGRGVILNLGSISWYLAQANLSIYMTAKAGIEGMTRGLARDLGGYGIRVNCIVPGAVRTPRQMKLWQTPESEAQLLAAQCLHKRVDPLHVARMALFLSSDDAECCTAREYFVDAGWYGG
ncbi:SDR family NAD(P)-dependent oxidoreductase [Hylemonella gracilis]|uniref:Short-chain dehydrogenase/reductase SDR n=1 Tax=Hylemonella gracilis ATCC 19624 TaxID=887062 RepID=F3KUG8_9BURK|nr:SDR family oxidoreductase [Hylemonella gracilis]EGI76545.1 short-chain dehydrogenase/reductase SDR [Hylemonella gracilis ATCC 19624]